MEREELENKVNEELGSTKLTLSEQTIGGELDDALEDFGDDEEANAKLITKLVNRLKRLDGNLHKEVSTQVEDYKKRNPKPKPTQKQKDGDGDEAPSWFKLYKEEQDKKWEAMETARKAAELKTEKDTVKKSVEKALKQSFKTAGVEPNNYILKQVMGRIVIPDENADADAIAKSAEKDYYKDLKEAGLDKNGGKPHFGGNGGKGNAQDAYFQKQAWYQKKHSGASK